MDEFRFSKSWIEISRSALRENFETIKKMVAPADIMPVIKADAYGHDLAIVGWELYESGATWFAVDNVEEGEDLRRMIGQSTIVVLGYIPRDVMRRALSWDLSFVLFDLGQLEAVEQALAKHPFLMRGKRARIHLPLETGLHREGFTKEELPNVLEKLKQLQAKFPSRILLEGVQMHFANVEDTEDPSYAQLQMKRFEEMEQSIKDMGFDQYKKHTASSAASFLYSNSRQDLIRPGIALYGLGIGQTLKPVLTWKTLVAQVKEVKAGEPIGYGLTAHLERDSKIAVIPVGYADGYDRGLSNQGEVLINGARCKVMGRVCMNMLMVDVTLAGMVQVEDEVVLIGQQKGESITMQELANKIGTIDYEIAARLNPNTPKIMVN